MKSWRHPAWSTGFICSFVCCVNLLTAQGRSLTVSELTQIYASGGDVAGWDEFDVPEFVAAAYGVRARDAVLAILEAPATPENYYLQLEALTTAQYPRVGVPTSVILEYAAGSKPGVNRGVLRHRAIMALSMRTDAGLTGFWIELSNNPEPSFRQLAAAGLSCVLGSEGVPHLAQLRADSKQAVANVADFYHREHTTKGAEALACGGRVSRSLVGTFPSELRPELRQRGDAMLRRIP